MMDKTHDSCIRSYQVDFTSLKIEMDTVTELEEQRKIVFEEFFAYHFEDPLPNSILLDIVEVEIEIFIQVNKELLETRKDYYWPMDYDDMEELITHLKENDYHCFEIQSSYGLNGWILSKGVYVEE